MTESLPRTSGTVAAIKASGNLVEINLSLFFAAAKNATQVQLVSGVFGDFSRAAGGKLNKLCGSRISLTQLVVSSFSLAT
jgi:hypothetical protein